MGAFCSSKLCSILDEENNTHYFSNNYNSLRDKNFYNENNKARTTNIIENPSKENIYDSNNFSGKNSIEEWKNHNKFHFKLLKEKTGNSSNYGENVVPFFSNLKLFRNENTSKLSKTQYKFLHKLFKKKMFFIEKDLFENTEKLYYKAIREFTKKNTSNDNLFDKNNFEYKYIVLTSNEKKLLFFTKILIINNSFYSGQVNLQSMKHGFGILYLSDRSSFEGFWVNDSFISGRYTDSINTIYEGIILFR